MTCVQEAVRTAPQQRTLVGGVIRYGTPVVTFTLIGICLAVFIGELIPGLELEQALLYEPFLTEFEPWRMMTAVFAHSTSFLLHIVINMYSLYILGQVLEPVFGRSRFLALFLVSGLAGSVGVLLLSNPRQGVLGASGAIFGLFGALFVLQLKRRGNLRQIVVLLAINGFLGFFIAGIAWQAHLGGLIGGALLAAIMIYAPGKRKIYQWVAGVALVLLLVLVTVWRTMVLDTSILLPIMG